MNSQTNVFVVDDDAAVRDALTMLLEASGHNVSSFSSAGDFIDACTPDIPGCIILDLNMPGMDGLMLQEELARRGIQLPVIFLSGHGTIPVTVRTIRAGAMDFLTKPVDGAVLLARVRQALDLCLLQQQQNNSSLPTASRLAKLTSREHEIMLLVVAGKTSKQIAQHLAISFRTVEVHRAHLMQKTGASNVLELSRVAGIFESPQSPQ